MPVLSSTRVEHPPGAHNLASLKPNDEIFIVRGSGEAVKHYGDFIDKQHAYAQPNWSDRYYGRSKLTYQQALAMEKQAEEQLRAQFPKHLEGEAVKLIHHSVLRKDDLVNKLYETIKGSKAGDDQKPAADQQQQQLPAEAAAKAANVTKRLLTTFLIYVADKQKPGVWVCKDAWVEKYGLAAELPSNLQPASIPASPAREGSQGSKARDTTPMKSPSRRPSAAALSGGPEPVRTLEEEEARLKPGTLKALAFGVMKQRGVTAPVSVDDIVRISTTDGSWIDWQDKTKRTLANVLRENNCFIRVTKGVYTLRCWASELPPQPDQGPAAASGGVKDAPAASGKATSEAGEQQQGLARAEAVLAQAQKALAARKADADAAVQALDACQKRLAEAKEAEKSKAKQTPSQSAGSSKGPLANGVAAGSGQPGASFSKEELDARFALPDRLKDYTGPEDDRKAKVAWRQEKAAEEKRLAQERAAYLQQLRLAAAKTARAGTEQLQAAVDRAKKEAEEANAKLGRALKAEADAQRAVEREKQREMLKDLKEKSKADKEKQKQAEKELREKRKQEALAAKRYPIDDLELLSEELTAAATAALAAQQEADADAAGVDAAEKLPLALLSAEQADLTCLSSAQHLDEAASQHMGQVLYVADTLSQFAKQLGLKGCSMVELQGILDAAASGAAVGGAVGDGGDAKVVREALAWLACTYQGLLKVLLRDVTEAENAARVFSRWEQVAEESAGAWPDVMRRWVMLQAQEGLAAPAALSAAEFLHKHDAGQLSPQQHLALLTQLLDDVMDTSLIRDLLAHRLEEAQEAAAGLREQLTEARRKLREVLEEEKEHKKKRRAAALALATAAAERQLREQGQLATATSAGAEAAAGDADAPAEVAAEPPAAVTAGDAPAEGDAAAGAAGQGGKKGKQVSTKDKEEALLKAKRKEIMERAGLTDKATIADVEAELADLEEVEPSWELPPELQEYSGPSGDKKAMSEFRRKQQEERKRLDKAKTKWHSEQSKRARERAEAKRKELEEDKRLAKERQKAEEEVAELQDRLEQQEGRYAVRRQPLGSDRFNRSYWWGLAGNKDALLLQQEVGAAETTLELLTAAAKDAAAAAAAGPSAAHMMASVFAGGNKTPGSAGKAGSTADTEGGQAGSSAGQQQQQQRGAGEGLNHKGLNVARGREGWAMLDQPDQVEALMGACEVRGVREKELKASLDKVLPSLTTALTKAAAAKAAAAAAAAAAAEAGAEEEAQKGSKSAAKKKKEPEAVAPRALPSRHARSAAAEQIRKTGTAAGKAKEEAAAAATALAAAAAAVGGDEEVTGPFSGWQLAAVKSAVSSLESLCQPAAAAKAPPPAPSTTWNQYTKALHGLISGEVPVTWQAATTAAAIELLTGKSQAGGSSALTAEAATFSRDAAWARAVAAAGATPADAHGDEDAAARHVVLGQLRLQLLQVEQQLVAATGEGPYLTRGADAADEDDEHAEGVEESSEGEAGQPAAAAAGDAADADAMDIDGEEQGDEASPADAKGGKKAAAKAGKARQGVKRAASSNALGPSTAAAAAAAGAGSHEEEPAAKRRKGGAAAAAAAGLPPLPASRNRGRASAAGQAGDTSQPPSRQNSLAPANSGALPAAAFGRGQKQGRHVSQELSHDAEGEDEEEGVQTSRGKKQAAAKGRGKAAAKGKAAAAAVTESMDISEGVSEDGVNDEEVQKGKRRSLAHLRALHEQGVDDDPDEEVAEESDAQPHLPFRLKGKTIWHTPAEREAWRAAVGAAATAASLAFCAAALVFHAQGPLQALGEKGKGGKQKQLPAPAQQQQAGSSRGGSRRK